MNVPFAIKLYTKFNKALPLAYVYITITCTFVLHGVFTDANRKHRHAATLRNALLGELPAGTHRDQQYVFGQMNVLCLSSI